MKSKFFRRVVILGVMGLCVSTSVVMADTGSENIAFINDRLPALNSLLDKQASPVVEVYVLQSLPDTTVTTLSDCSQVSALLIDAPEPLIQLGESIIAEVMGFSAQWLATDGKLVTQNNNTIQVTPIGINLVTLAVLEVRREDWDLNPTLEGRDLSALRIDAACHIATAVDFFSADIQVEVDENIRNWLSADAADNQIKYDNAESDIIKQFYGTDGLGYGDFAKAGLAYTHARKLPGLPWSYGTFSLHWKVSELDAMPWAAELIPADIVQNYLHGWSDSCEPIKVRLGRDEYFYEASIGIINNVQRCNEQPLFILSDAPAIPNNQTPQFQTYIDFANRLHYLALPLDNEGNLVPCVDEDLLSMDGCSQPIVASFEPFLNTFYRGVTDLYLELTFGEHVRKVFHMSAAGGIVEEIDSQTLGF